MKAFRFRMATVLGWYRKQCEFEENRLRQCAEFLAGAKAEIERHKNEVLQKTELIRSPTLQAYELAALGSFCQHARRVDRQLLQRSLKAEQAVAQQREIVQAARRRLRLVEKLQERHLEEYRLEADREMDEFASETHLAGYVRALTDRS
jgi:flagellar export protein FliJ